MIKIKNFIFINLIFSLSTLGASPDYSEQIRNNTLLWKGASRGINKLIEEAIEKGANINATDNYEMTALMKASFSGHLSSVLLLLKNGAKVNEQNIKGETALYLAVKNKKNLVAKHLLTNKYNPIDLTLTNSKKQTILHKAVKKGSQELVKTLVHNKKKELDINAQDEEGRTPLFLATAKNETVIVHILLNAGANPSLRDITFEEKPLTIARRGNSFVIMEALAKAEIASNPISREAYKALRWIRKMNQKVLENFQKKHDLI